MTKKPLVSVIVVNYNGRKWLTDCFKSLSDQDYPNYELILVDNHSTDGSLELMRRKFAQVKVVANPENSGFAGGNNLGLTVAKGEYLILINNDTRVESSYISDLMLAFKKIPKLAMAQSKIRLMKTPNLLDTCGSFWTRSTFLYHVGNGKSADLPQYQQPFPVFSTKGASVIIKRQAVEKLGLFDGDFWCYYEETDLCHRLWLSGYECWYWPKAEVWHAAGGTSLTFPNDFIQFHNFKNKLLSMLKNFEIQNLCLIVPIFLLLNIGLSFIWLVQGKYRHSWSLYRAVGWNLGHLSSTLAKRAKIQAGRRVRDQEYLRKCQRDPAWRYYQYLFKDQIALYYDE